MIAETTPVTAPVAQALTVQLVKSSVYVGLIIWLSIITLAIIVIILRLIYVFHNLRENQLEAMDQITNSAFDNSKYSQSSARLTIDHLMLENVNIHRTHHEIQLYTDNYGYGCIYMTLTPGRLYIA